MTNNDYPPRPSKGARLEMLISRLKHAPAVTNGLLAYKLISETLNDIEDVVLGKDCWDPPRTFVGGITSERLYPTCPESILPVPNKPNLAMLTHVGQIIFIAS